MATSTPWTVNNFHENLKSPDKQYQVMIKTCKQFEMGSPWQVDYYLQNTANNQEILISDLAAAPLLWNQTSNYFVFAQWYKKATSNFNHYWFQRLCLFDIANMEKIIFKEQFEIVQLERFNTYVIKGVDVPKDKYFSFNVFSNEVYLTEKLKLA